MTFYHGKHQDPDERPEADDIITFAVCLILAVLFVVWAAEQLKGLGQP